MAPGQLSHLTSLKSKHSPENKGFDEVTWPSSLSFIKRSTLNELHDFARLIFPSSNKGRASNMEGYCRCYLPWSLLGAHDDLWEVPPPGWYHGYPPCVISNHGSASQQLIAYVWIESMGESKTLVNKAGSLSHGFSED